MYQKVSLIIFVCIVGGVFLAGCEVFAGHNTPMAMATSENNDTGIANPAAVYCEKQVFARNPVQLRMAVNMRYASSWMGLNVMNGPISGGSVVLHRKIQPRRTKL